jgi:hypothetical protein
VEAGGGDAFLLPHEGAAEKGAHCDELVGDDEQLAAGGEGEDGPQQTQGWVRQQVPSYIDCIDWAASVRCSEGKRFTRACRVVITLAPRRIRRSCYRLCSTIF